MLKQAKYLDLIVRYLNNPQDEELRAALKSYLDESPENTLYFNEVDEIWSLSAKAARLSGLNSNKSIKRFEQSLGKISSRSNNLLRWISGIAATVLICYVSFLAINQDKKYLIAKTSKNKIDTLLLADGSEVILARNSTLKYPKQFDGDAREVYLENGIAFFKVVKDPNHPFSVVMGASTVSVLGTSFNLSFSKKNIELDVKTGRVMFKPYESAASSILIAGQGLSYIVDKKEISAHIAQNVDSWSTKELVFVDTPLEEVCKQLADAYQVSIKFDGSKRIVKKFNATFKNESLADIFEVLKETYNLKIVENGSQITIKTP